MVKYSFKTAIPTTSISKGLVFDNDMYFSSNTYIYKYSRSVYSVVSSLPGNIKNFFLHNDKFYALTDEHLVISYNGRNIASMKKDGNCILATDEYIFTNDNNELEVWHNPKEFSMNMFELHCRNSEHTGRISVLLLYKNMVITGSCDHTIRAFDMETRRSRRILTVKSRPIGIHEIEDWLVVVCLNGQSYKIKYNEDGVDLVEKDQREGLICCSNLSNGILCFSVYKDDKSLIEVVKEDSVIYSVELNNKVEEVALRDSLLAIKCQDFVGLYNLKSDSFLVELVLPSIVDFDINREYVAVGCSDKKIRLYDDNRIINTFRDEKSTYPIFKTFFVKNSVLSLAIDGHVSLFDIKNGTCFRSFKIPIKISSATVCSDGILLFLGDYDTCSIRIVDLQRSKEIDQLEGHEAAIKHLRYHRGCLYSLSLDNELRKWDYLKGDSERMVLDKMPLSISVDYNQIAISFENEVVTYDLDLVYLYSFDYSIKNRKRNELYMHEKGAEHVEFSLGGRNIILGGEYNKLYVCDISSGEIVQQLQLSQNKAWENYDDKFYKERKHSFDKSKVVETLKLKHSPDQYKFYVQSREGIVVFGKNSTQFSPLDLDVETTPDGIKKYIEEQEYLKGLLGALRVGDLDLIQFVLFSIPEEKVEFAVKYIPKRLVNILREALLKIVQEEVSGNNSTSKIEMVYLWLRFILFYHASSETVNSGLETFKKKGEDIYKVGLENIFLLKKILKK
ncbi:Periodic tryptophan protein 2 like protein [Nosema granulosis]|uniref:Periodic tryptophan protein 2 like protein n=1 Tax=Nosema granulosis TaxID=83296 RepID=A0A9P6GZ46_9MICR|nr:Periodic tryptophan protein 2 like protein [Nosema granulosis]